MIVVETVGDASQWAEHFRSAALSLGLVPTMGALHEGHLSLVRAARRECDRVALTIFVNPTQFAPGEDLESYPRQRERDLRLCRDAGVDLVLVGRFRGEGAVYPEGFETWVELEHLPRPLCGAFRPGHFRGVATVVAILFGIFKPHRAYFGLKDYQQARILERLARDLRTGVDVRLLPTVREPDGLAMSSRNKYLSPSERVRASSLSRALAAVQERYRGGEERPAALLASFRDALADAGDLQLQYAELRDALTLEEIGDSRISDRPRGAVLAAAVLCGTTRLIDNVWLDPRPDGGGAHEAGE